MSGLALAPATTPAFADAQIDATPDPTEQGASDGANPDPSGGADLEAGQDDETDLGAGSGSEGAEGRDAGSGGEAGQGELLGGEALGLEDAPAQESLNELGGGLITPFNAPGNSFCTAPGVFTLAMENNPFVRSLQLNGQGSNAQSGTLGYTGIDALAITSDGNWAYAVNSTGSNGFNLHRLSASSSNHEALSWIDAGVTNFQQPTAGAMKRVGSNEIYYFGYYTRSSGTTYFQLYAYNATTSIYIGRVAQVQMPSSASSVGAGGDIAFDAQGNLVLLWSTGTTGVLAQLLSANVPNSVPGNLNRTATQLSTVSTVGIGTSPWNGLAFDSNGELWLQAATTILTGTLGITYLQRVNPTNGALLGTLESRSGYTGNDLASCGFNPAPTLVLQKALTNNRFASNHQFRLDVRQAGSGTELAVRTTTGAGSNIDSAPTDAVNLTAGAQYTIAEQGVPTGILGNYDSSYECRWSSTPGSVFASGSLTPVSNRAQSSAFEIPAGREGQVLNCTITNTSRAIAMTLQSSLTNERFNTGDQFLLDIRSASGSLATATTNSSGTGVQTPAAGPVNVTAGAVYTIAVTGAEGASLGNYTFDYACTWADNTPLAGGPLAYDPGTGRAQATLSQIPAGREGDVLACTITKTAKNPAEVPPQLILRKNVISRVNSVEDQFELGIHNVGETAAISSAVTAGTVAGGPGAIGLQDAFAGPVTVEAGNAYVISEAAAGNTDLSGYTASFECRWNDAGNSLFSRGSLSLGANERMQALLPAIPAGRNGQTLSCTISNQVRVSGGLDCAVDTVYGQLHMGRTTSGTQTFTNQTRRMSVSDGVATTSAVTFPATGATTALRGWNGLAINRDGSEAISVRQQRDAATEGTNQIRLSRWNVNETPQMIENAVLYTGPTSPVRPANIIGGGIDPTSGDYYFGGFTAGTPSTLQLFRVPKEQATTSYEFVGNITVPGSSGSGNGDFAFDAQGNLYFVWSLNTHTTHHLLLRVDAATLDSLNGGTQAAAAVSNWSNPAGNSDVYNGIAFDGQGYLWVSFYNPNIAGSPGGARRVNPSTGQIVDTPVDGSWPLVDMASCGLPPTMRLQKDIEGRYAAGNQFELHIDTGSVQDIVPSATTSGSTTGLQPQNVGPAVVVVGQQYTIRETRAGSPQPSFANYITSYECRWSDEDAVWASGVLGTTVTSTTRSQTLAPIPAGKSGQQLVCTIFNEPVFPAMVTAKKTVVDANGENPVGAAGWSITASRVASGSSTSTEVMGAATRVTALGGSVPVPWEVYFPNSTALLNLRLAEQQQPGFALVPGANTGGTITGSHCVITPPVGPSNTVLLTSESTDLSGDDRIRAGDQVECEFVNRQLPGSATWQKVDGAEASTHLGGSEWLLTGPGVPADTIVTDCVEANAGLCGTGTYADRDPRPGYFEIEGLVHGDYELAEHKAPAGFIKVDTVREFSITPDDLDYAFSAPFVNQRIEMPAIPLTGGTARDIFAIGGIGLLALGLLWAWAYRRRQLRLQES